MVNSDTLPNQNHLSFGGEVFKMGETAKSMDLLTGKLCDLAAIDGVKDRVSLISGGSERLEEAKEIGLLKKQLYIKLFEDIEKQYTSKDGKILIQVPLSHAGDFIPYLIERGDNPKSKFSKLDIEYVIVDPESIAQISENEEEVKKIYDYYLKKTQSADKFIQIVDTGNGPEEHAPESHKSGVGKVFQSYKAQIAGTEKLRLYFPTQKMADAEGMNLAEFYRLYINACSLDWERIKEGNEEIAELFREYDNVNIEGEGTSINFSIEGMGAQNSVIETNYPGSETYSAPVRNGTNGYITYGETNISMVNEVVPGFKLIFKEGRLESFELLGEYQEGEKERITQKIENKLNEHEANRYLGEIAFGTNFMVPVGIKHSLIGEKAAGMHIALGRAFAKGEPGEKGYVDNGNNKFGKNGHKKNPATIHCDLIRSMNDGTIVTFSKKSGKSIEVMNNGNFSKKNTPILANYQREILHQQAA